MVMVGSLEPATLHLHKACGNWLACSRQLRGPTRRHTDDLEPLSSDGFSMGLLPQRATTMGADVAK